MILLVSFRLFVRTTKFVPQVRFFLNEELKKALLKSFTEEELADLR